MRNFRKIWVGYVLSAAALPLLAIVPFRTDLNILSPGYVTTNASQFSFGDVNLGSDSQQTLVIYNGTTDTLDLVVAPATTSPVFQPSQWTTTTLFPLDSIVVDVTFSPTSNIAYQEFLVAEILNCDRPIVMPLTGNGRAESYYALTFNTFGEELKSVMPNLFPGKIDLGYNGGRAKMYGFIDNHNDSLTCVYTGFTQYWPYGSTGTFPDPINCEHTWPQSYFNEENPMRGDINHLFPTHMDANSRRSNYAFGNVVQNITWQDAGSKLGQNNYSEIVFEPRDGHKGDAARAIFYFVTRYGNRENYLGTHQEADLREWFWEDPVSQKEIDRNNGVDQYQHNRNPFIDHPEFLDRISSLSGTATVPESPEIVFAPLLAEYVTSSEDTVFHIIANVGNAVLEISGIAENLSWLAAIEPFPQSIPPGESWSFRMIFSPDAGAGAYAGNFDLTSNDPENPTISVPISFLYQPTVGIMNEALPEKMDLLKTYPNPFNATVTLAVTLSAVSETQIELYDLGGRKLQTWRLAPGNGSREMAWNARDQTGAELSSGIYLVRVTQGQHSVLERLVLLR